MRSTQTCPKCTGKKLVVVAEFRQPDHDSSNLTLTFPAITVRVPGGFFGDRKSFGTLETWICAACGYTELYARGLRNVDRLAAEFPDQVRIVDTTPPQQGPFR